MMVTFACFLEVRRIQKNEVFYERIKRHHCTLKNVPKWLGVRSPGSASTSRAGAGFPSGVPAWTLCSHYSVSCRRRLHLSVGRRHFAAPLDHRASRAHSDGGVFDCASTDNEQERWYHCSA